MGRLARLAKPLQLRRHSCLDSLATGSSGVARDGVAALAPVLPVVAQRRPLSVESPRPAALKQRFRRGRKKKHPPLVRLGSA